MDRMGGADRVGATSDRPIAPILPSSMKRVSVPIIAATGTRGSRRWM